MTIDKAIEILTQARHSAAMPWEPDVEDAMKLGIEALKLVKNQRGHRWVDAPKPLPGETEE